MKFLLCIFTINLVVITLLSILFYKNKSFKYFKEDIFSVFDTSSEDNKYYKDGEALFYCLSFIISKIFIFLYEILCHIKPRNKKEIFYTISWSLNIGLNIFLVCILFCECVFMLNLHYNYKNTDNSYNFNSRVSFYDKYQEYMFITKQSEGIIFFLTTIINLINIFYKIVKKSLINFKKYGKVVGFKSNREDIIIVVIGIFFIILGCIYFTKVLNYLVDFSEESNINFLKPLYLTLTLVSIYTISLHLIDYLGLQRFMLKQEEFNY